MTEVINRRSILAAGVVALPSVAIAGGGALSMGSGMGTEFHDLMEQAGDHLKAMRSHMEDLTAPGAREEAAFLANQVTILMAQSIVVADQVDVPVRSAEKYEGAKDRFTSKLRLGLSGSIDACNALYGALVQEKDERAVTYYGKLRKARKNGHDAFKEDD